MKKNVVFMACVVNKDKSKKYGDFDYFDYSIKTWEYWCKLNDCIFFLFDEPYMEDMEKYRINWQKEVFVFDILEKNNIDYDQILILDSTCMIKWNAPNFFELTDHQFTVSRDMDNMRWIHNSVEGYKEFFDGFDFDIKKYFNSGFVIFNDKHRDFFESFKQMYLENVDELLELHKKTGTAEQTPLNYWAQIKGMDLNFINTMLYRCSHLYRKEMLSYNWQLNEDNTPFFIKYPYVWMFSGFDKSQREPLMKKTWDLVNHFYTYNETDRLLNLVNHKDTYKNATSRKFKLDLIEFFEDDKYREMSVLELGACQGDTTRIFSELFKKVYAVDRDPENIQKLRQKCSDVDNVDISMMDVTNDSWDFPQVDVVFVDASHDYPQVALDIQKCIDLFDKPIIILDDYGNPNNRNIRASIDDKIREGKIRVDKKIGEDIGFVTKAGWKMIDREGVICRA
tara:strand:- start:530 stop:1885 length:1356 start_codon:yes stop_codon:yes gene_type:complete